eukprot:2081378-Rhodomonas_salina.3
MRDFVSDFQVFELARRIGSEDVALKLGPQNFSMCGHAAVSALSCNCVHHSFCQTLQLTATTQVKQRVLETADWLQNEAPRQYEVLGKQISGGLVTWHDILSGRSTVITCCGCERG